MLRPGLVHFIPASKRRHSASLVQSSHLRVKILQRAEAHSPCVKHSHVGDRGFEQPHLLLIQRRLAQRVSIVGVHSQPSGRIHTSVHEGLVVTGGRGVGTLVRFTGAGVITVVNTRVVRVVVVVVGAIRGEINAENVTPYQYESFSTRKKTRACRESVR